MEGVWKLNMDGSFRGEGRVGGRGDIRDFRGTFIGGFVEFLGNGNANALVAELHALLKGLLLSSLLKVGKLWIEIDPKQWFVWLRIMLGVLGRLVNGWSRFIVCFKVWNLILCMFFVRKMLLLISLLILRLPQAKAIFSRRLQRFLC